MKGICISWFSPDLAASLTFALLGVREQPCFLLAKFGRKLLTEILSLEDSSELALALRTKASRGVNLHKSLGPLDRLGLRRELEDRVAGDQLLRFREGPVDHRALASGVPDPR